MEYILRTNTVSKKYTNYYKYDSNTYLKIQFATFHITLSFVQNFNMFLKDNYLLSINILTYSFLIFTTFYNSNIFMLSAAAFNSFSKYLFCPSVFPSKIV